MSDYLYFYLVPYEYDQDILSINVLYSNGNSLHLRWDLSHQPIADEHFKIEFTIQSVDNSVTKSEVNLSCDAICESTQRVTYELTDINTDSIYLAEITVINLYGQSTKMYQFYPQAIISKATGGLPCAGVYAIIVVPLVTIILLLISGYIILLFIYVAKYYKAKNLKHELLSNPDRQYMEMSARDTTTDGYYNLPDESGENPRSYNITSSEAIAEPTYAHIDDAGMVIEAVVNDRDYEVMQTDDSPRVTYSNVSNFEVKLNPSMISLFFSLAFITLPIFRCLEDSILFFTDFRFKYLFCYYLSNLDFIYHSSK